MPRIDPHNSTQYWWDRHLRGLSLLRPTSVDPDLLEERARTVLNLGQPDELVILLNQPKAAKPN